MSRFLLLLSAVCIGEAVAYLVLDGCSSESPTVLLPACSPSCAPEQRCHYTDAGALACMPEPKGD